MHYHLMRCAQRVPNIPALVNIAQMLHALRYFTVLHFGHAQTSYMLLIETLHVLTALEVGQFKR